MSANIQKITFSVIVFSRACDAFHWFKISRSTLIDDFFEPKLFYLAWMNFHWHKRSHKTSCKTSTLVKFHSLLKYSLIHKTCDPGCDPFSLCRPVFVIFIVYKFYWIKHSLLYFLSKQPCKWDSYVGFITCMLRSLIHRCSLNHITCTRSDFISRSTSFPR